MIPFIAWLNPTLAYPQKWWKMVKPESSKEVNAGDQAGVFCKEILQPGSKISTFLEQDIVLWGLTERAISIIA